MSFAPRAEDLCAAVPSAFVPEDLLRLARRHASSIVLLAVLLLCVYLRFINLGWGLGSKLKAGWHPDEQIVVGVDGSLAANHFDTDMGRAPIPEGLTWAHYNFSSYFYVTYIWHQVATNVVRSKAQAVLIYRQFSACLGVLVCLLVYGCARRFLDCNFAALAAMFAGVLPLLVQDSHYARAETFVTAGSVALLWLALAMASRCTSRRCLWSGVLVGFLAACKISLAPMLCLPAAAICVCYWPTLRASFRGAVRPFALLVAGFLAGFLAGVPYILVHTRTWWGGWDHLHRQYSNPFVPYGTDPPGYCFGLIADYFLSSFGAPLLAGAAVGVVGLMRKKQYLYLVFLITPVAFYYLTFGFQMAFFERNVSHVAPWIALLAACGCQEVRDQLNRLTDNKQLRAAVLAVVIVVCLWRPLTLSWRIAVVVMSGKAYDPSVECETAIRAAYSNLPLVFDHFWAPKFFEDLQQNAAANPNGYILKVADPGDERSRHRQFLAEHIYHMRLLAYTRGRFADLPVSTLQMYHSENCSWYLVEP